MRVRVLLADRQRIIRQGVRILLEREGLDVVGEATDVDEAARLAEALKPDVVVLEGYAPSNDGLDAARRIASAWPPVKAVVLANTGRWDDVQTALPAGISGCVLTSQHATDLAHAIREVARGATYVGRPASASANGTSPPAGAAEQKERLTPRERQVLQLIAEGRTTKEIAQILQRSAKTADAHRTRLMEKLDIHQVAGLVRYAIRKGLIQA
jgi:DNA-binding NarL/FixJ family response regulator